ncbi:MAG: RsmG family class I SAM-dependent methyltransferase [Myxococcota bacterium]|nr:RsmG family class I SAM-dependent methyltransferase [Myxococcota bacterium]
MRQPAEWIEAAGLDPKYLNRESWIRISDYFELRKRWANTHNLAGPKALRDPWQVDLIDAYALRTVLEPGRLLIDVGTGSGTPGVLVACLLPTHPVWLVEPNAKRTAFLRAAITALGLGHVKVNRGRWPMNVSHETYQIVSRAVVNPAAWPTLAAQGSPAPATIHRMLAQHRPTMTLTAYHQTRSIHYHVQSTDDRCIESWAHQM